MSHVLPPTWRILKASWLINTSSENTHMPHESHVSPRPALAPLSAHAGSSASPVIDGNDPLDLRHRSSVEEIGQLAALDGAVVQLPKVLPRLDTLLQVRDRGL
eukprot:9532850-Alexandrium_andersonii.AAC.1